MATGPWYVGGTLGTGNLDFSNVQRNIALGAATRTETGNTNGYHNVARLLGGYWFKYSDWDHGPFAKLTWEKAVVRQFSEQGSDSTALSYGQQENEALISSLGWQVDRQLERLAAVRARDVGIRLQERRARRSPLRRWA